MAIQTIESVQRDYFALLDERLGLYLRELPALDDRSAIEYLNSALASQRLIVPTPAGNLTALEFAILSWTLDVQNFWSSRGDGLLSAMRNLDPFRIQTYFPDQYLSLESDVRRLGLLFDFVVIPDPLSGHWTEKDFMTQRGRQLMLTNFRRAVVLYRLREIVLTSDAPLFCIVAPASRDLCESAGDLTVSFLAQIFEGIEPGDDVDGVVELFASALPSDTALQVVDQDLFSEFIDQSFSRTSDLRVILDRESGNLSRARIPFAQMKREDWYPGMPSVVFSRIDGLLEHLGTSYDVGADPIVALPRWAVFKWYLGQQTKPMRSSGEFSEEELLAKALHSERLSFLSDVPTRVLGALRENDGLESLRAVIKLNRSELKTLTVEDFVEKADETAARLAAAVRVYGEELSALRETIASNKREAVAGVMLSAVLQLVGVALPPLAVPTAIGGLVLGGVSLRDVINRHIEGKRRLAALHQRPVGILWEWQQGRTDEVTGSS